MSGGSTKTTSQQTSTTSNNIDPRQLAMLESNYATARENAGKLRPYSGPLTAGFTPLQERAQAMLADTAGDRGGQDALKAARGGVQSMLNYRPSSLPLERIAAPLAQTQAPVKTRDVIGARVESQAPLRTGTTEVSLAGPQERVTAERIAASIIAPRDSLRAPVIEAALAARAAPVRSADLRAGQLAETDLSAYMSPYQKAVIDSRIAGNERARALAVAANARKASAANAFGGSRSAVLDALTNEGYDRNSAGSIANLNAANFAQAREAAGADIDRRFGADRFNAESRLAADTLNANLGQQVELANQQALNSIRSQNAANEMNSGQFNASLSQQAALANQTAENETARLNAGNRLSADTLNANLGQQTELANQAALNESARFDAANALNAGQFNANLAQAAALANQASANDAVRFNAGNRLAADTLNANLGQQAALANQSAEMNARQFNAGNARATAQADIDNALAAYGLSLNAAGQLVALNNAALGDAATRAGLLGSAGDAQQAQEQARLNALYQEYLRQQQFPITEQQMLNSALGLIPVQQTTIGSSNGTNTEKKSGDLLGGILGTIMGGARLGASFLG